MKKIMLTILTVGLFISFSSSVSADFSTSDITPSGFGFYHG